MADESMYQEAKNAATQGQRERARDLLTRLLRADQSNPEHWLWMSAVVDTPKERTYCLQNVLRLDPNSHAARRGLVLLGALPPENVTPVPPIRRKWVVAEEEIPTAASGATHALRVMVLLSLSVLVIGLAIVGFLGMGLGKKGLFAPHLTITPKPWTPRPTATLLPTNTPYARTPTPTFTGPKPLWMQLDATYTPTPLYVNTSHPISEAYRAGLREFQRGDYPTMLQFMEQAAKIEPQAADAFYYVGEARLLIGQPEQALTAYEKAITANPAFAPAYVGRARAQLILRPRADISDDLNTAISLDPALAEAYLERAALRVRGGEYEAALEDLGAVETLRPDSPLLYLYKAQALLALGEDSAALEAAQRAHELDFTLLPAYLTLGQAFLRADQPQEAIGPLQTYTLYAMQDASGWAALGQAIYASSKNYKEAVKALDKALGLDENLTQAYLYRGLAYLELGDGKAAVNDLYQAIQVEKNSFEVNLAFARALLLDDRAKDAVTLFNTSQKYAESDEQLAAVYYWRAQAYEAIENKTSAIQDWQALLDLSPDLPTGDVFESWTSTAEEHLLAFTPTSIPSATPTGRGTATPTRTTPSAPSPRTGTPSPTATPPTRTGTTTPGLTATPTP